MCFYNIKSRYDWRGLYNEELVKCTYANHFINERRAWTIYNIYTPQKVRT